MKVKLTFAAPKGTRRKDTVVECDGAKFATPGDFDAVRQLLSIEQFVNTVLPDARLLITVEHETGSVDNG
jgi:hypothetical protein